MIDGCLDNGQNTMPAICFPVSHDGGEITAAERCSRYALRNRPITIINMKQSPGLTKRPSGDLLCSLAPSRWGSTRKFRRQHSSRLSGGSSAVSSSNRTSAPGEEKALQQEGRSTNNHPEHQSGLNSNPPALRTSQSTHGSIHHPRGTNRNREAFIHRPGTDDSKCSTTSGDDFRASQRSPTPDEDMKEEVSQESDFEPFDDDLLRPLRYSQVAEMASLFPIPVKSSGFSIGSDGTRKERRLRALSPQHSISSLPRPSSALSKSPKKTAASIFSFESQAGSDRTAPLSPGLPSPSTSDFSHSLKSSTTLSKKLLADLHDNSRANGDTLKAETNGEDGSDFRNGLKHAPSSRSTIVPGIYSLERRTEELYSAEHLEFILGDDEFLHKFTQFLRIYRPSREPILAHYLSAKKAIQALAYANALTALLAERKLPYKCLLHPPSGVRNMELDLAAKQAFDELLKDDLHYYIAHIWTDSISALIKQRITGTLAPYIRESHAGLGEVFVIADPRREDCPIIFASEMFASHTGFSLEYIIGRNCRFLQGPRTTTDSVRRFAISNKEAKDHTEILLNYRGDGTPFLSMVMNTPLLDSFGKVRYFLGAQVDVSGLLQDCTGLESLSRLLEKRNEHRNDSVQDDGDGHGPDQYATLKNLCQKFTAAELAIINKESQTFNRKEYMPDDAAPRRKISIEKRLFLADGSESDSEDQSESTILYPEHPPAERPISTGKLPGAYKDYLLLRPAPYLRILFSSPSIREPGLLQTPFLNRIGGSKRTRRGLGSALKASQPVTARVRWLRAANENGEGEGITRWLHCTPLLNSSNQVGMWMVVIVQPEKEIAESVYSDKSSRTTIRSG